MYGAGFIFVCAVGVVMYPNGLLSIIIIYQNKKTEM